MEIFKSISQFLQTFWASSSIFSLKVCIGMGVVLILLCIGDWIKLQSLQWRHNGRDGVSDHQPYDCLLNRFFRRRSKKTSKLRVTGLCVGNSPVTGEFPAQRASNAETVSIWWHHHAKLIDRRECLILFTISIECITKPWHFPFYRHFVSVTSAIAFANGQWWGAVIFVIVASLNKLSNKQSNRKTPRNIDIFRRYNIRRNIAEQVDARVTWCCIFKELGLRVKFMICKSRCSSGVFCKLIWKSMY